MLFHSTFSQRRPHMLFCVLFCVSDLYSCIMGLENESEKDVRSKKKSFPDLARAAGLKDSTVEILLKEDFDSVESIRCLTEDIVQEMGLTKAQLCLLQHWMKSLQPKRRGPTQSWDLPPPTKRKRGTRSFHSNGCHWWLSRGRSY